jgi:light-harvesting protein B-800-850 beta chain
MADDANRVWPTGLTVAESEELHSHLIEGSRVFGMIAVVAHILSFSLSPWLH